MNLLANFNLTRLKFLKIHLCYKYMQLLSDKCKIKLDPIPKLFGHPDPQNLRMLDPSHSQNSAPENRNKNVFIQNTTEQAEFRIRIDLNTDPDPDPAF